MIDSLEYDINGKIWQSAKTDLQIKTVVSAQSWMTCSPCGSGFSLT